MKAHPCKLCGHHANNTAWSPVTYFCSNEDCPLTPDAALSLEQWNLLMGPPCGIPQSSIGFKCNQCGVSMGAAEATPELRALMDGHGK